MRIHDQHTRQGSPGAKGNLMGTKERLVLEILERNPTQRLAESIQRRTQGLPSTPVLVMRSGKRVGVPPR